MIRTLTANLRTATGKGAARQSRAGGSCPANIYGKGLQPRSLSIDPKAFLKLISVSGGNILIDLEIREDETKIVDTVKVIIRETQYKPLGLLPSHVDFYQVALDQRISMEIPLKLIGTPEAIEDKSGVLNQHMHMLNIECLPTAIPTKLEIDVSGLEIGDNLQVKDLSFTEDIVLLDAPDNGVVALVPYVEIVEEEEEAAPETETAEPEVIGKDKEGEESAE